MSITLILVLVWFGVSFLLSMYTHYSDNSKFEKALYFALILGWLVITFAAGYEISEIVANLLI